MTGEARYWLGEFDPAQEALERGLDIAGATSDRVCADASRFLADIQLMVRGDEARASELFERALAASARLGDPTTRARTLLMAGWAPFWHNDLPRAEAMFREALAVARARVPRDAWAEARALTGIAGVVSPVGDEEEALRIGLEALAVGDEAGQAFTSAGAHETVAGSLRRLLRLDDALRHADAGVATLRELGARWELASALGDRGVIHRLAGRLEEGETDLREAFVLCRDLKERALVTWTAAELARLLALRGDASAARQVLGEPIARIAEGEPGSATALLTAEAVVALAEHDRETARVKSLEALAAERGRRGLPNPLAAQVVWTAFWFGAEDAGGAPEVEAAQERLQRNGWKQALAEPEQIAGLLG